MNYRGTKFTLSLTAYTPNHSSEQFRCTASGKRAEESALLLFSFHSVVPRADQGVIVPVFSFSLSIIF